VARYAESTGKEANFNLSRGVAVSRLGDPRVNADVPYDEFIRQQIAAINLPAKDGVEHADHLTATGFLAIGPKSLQEKNNEQFEMDQVDEQIDTTSRAVLGLTVAWRALPRPQFDPVPQKEYYAMAGIFRSTLTFMAPADRNQNRNASTLLPLPPPDEQLASTTKSAEGGRGGAKSPGNPQEQKKKKQQAAPAAVTTATGGEVMGVQDGHMTNCHVLVRGEVAQPGDIVPRGMLTVLSTGDAPKITSERSGAADLAEWLTSPTNR